MLDVFGFNSYKKYLDKWIETSGHGSLSKLAQAAGCHRTYMSQVLHSKVDLTLDHAANLVGFLGFNKEQSNYFLTSVMHDRASQRSARIYFSKQMQTMKQDNASVTSRMHGKSVEKASSPDHAKYYSDGDIAVVHLATSCSETQTPPKIAKAYGLDVDLVNRHLDYLVRIGFVRKHQNKFVHSGESHHLDKESSYTRINHLNWRLKANDHNFDDKSLHYSNVFSISRVDYEKLQDTLLKFIEKQNSMIKDSGSEQVVAFCCDLFPLEIEKK